MNIMDTKLRELGIELPPILPSLVLTHLRWPPRHDKRRSDRFGATVAGWFSDRCRLQSFVAVSEQQPFGGTVALPAFTRGYDRTLSPAISPCSRSN